MDGAVCIGIGGVSIGRGPEGRAGATGAGMLCMGAPGGGGCSEITGAPRGCRRIVDGGERFSASKIKCAETLPTI
jgi:hypothetical protein